MQPRITNLSLKVWEICKRIPKGRVCSYKDIAIALGNKNLARAVANALHKSPGMPYIPCHRVVRSNGFVGGFNKGIKAKVSLLKSEGIKIKNNRIINFNKLKIGADQLAGSKMDMA